MDAICPSAPQAQAPSGILESTAQAPIPTAPQALTSSLKKHRFLPVLFFIIPFPGYLRCSGRRPA